MEAKAFSEMHFSEATFRVCHCRHRAPVVLEPTSLSLFVLPEDRCDYHCPRARLHKTRIVQTWPSSRTQHCTGQSNNRPKNSRSCTHQSIKFVLRQVLTKFSRVDRSLIPTSDMVPVKERSPSCTVSSQKQSGPGQMTHHEFGSFLMGTREGTNICLMS